MSMLWACLRALLMVNILFSPYRLPSDTRGGENRFAREAAVRPRSYLLPILLERRSARLPLLPVGTNTQHKRHLSGAFVEYNGVKWPSEPILRVNLKLNFIAEQFRLMSLFTQT